MKKIFTTLGIVLLVPAVMGLTWTIFYLDTKSVWFASLVTLGVTALAITWSRLTDKKNKPLTKNH